jgi:hypothetical protein
MTIIKLSNGETGCILPFNPIPTLSEATLDPFNPPDPAKNRRSRRAFKSAIAKLFLFYGLTAEEITILKELIRRSFQLNEIS